MLLCLLMIIGMIAASAFTVSASDHKHYGVFVTKKLPTCSKEGNEAYYFCSCGKWFSDFECTKEIKDHNSVVIPKLDHTPSGWKYDATGHYKSCTSCGTVTTAKSAHTFGDWKVTKDATETAAGSKTRTCTVCSYTETQTIPAKGPSHTHSYVQKYDENYHWEECSCGDIRNRSGHDINDDGECSVCGYNLRASCTHDDYEYRNAKPATCTEEGYDGDKYCTKCGALLESGEVIPMAEHDFDEDGICTKCGLEKETDDTVPLVIDPDETDPDEEDDQDDPDTDDPSFPEFSFNWMWLLIPAGVILLLGIVGLVIVITLAAKKKL